ncbi:MAG TPA: SxtJ family membrane protein [Verrucomicrobiae bacterium]|nr:SxtJ family membrane protein [Verrucomicrobiae bacterium]
MKWNDISSDPTTRNLRQFAGAWLAVLLATGAHQYFVRGRHHVGLVMIILAVAVGALGLIRPSAIRWLYIGLMVAAFPIGWAVTQIMLALMFYCVITPVGLLFRLMGRDLLAQRPANGKPSYWTAKETPEDSRRYLRQY